MKKIWIIIALFIIVGVVVSVPSVPSSEAQTWDYSNNVTLYVDGHHVTPIFLRVDTGILEAHNVGGTLTFLASVDHIYITVPADNFADGWHTIQIISSKKSITNVYYKTNATPDTVHGGIKVEFRNDVRGRE